jgi:hypothetical protein
MTNRFLDPMAPARSFAARRAGMTDGRKLRRELQRLKRKVSPSFGGEDVPAEWTMIEEIDELPEADDDVIGRIFVKKNDDAEDSLVAGVTAADGLPILITLGVAQNAGLRWQSLVDGLASDVLGVAVDTSGNLYVSLESGDLKKYDSALALQWTQTLAGGGHVATDGTSVFVASEANDTVYKRLASTGAAGSPATIGSTGTGNGEFDGPIGVATDGSTLWVVDSGNGRVQKFDAGTGVYASQFDGSSSGLAFDRPTGITLLVISGVAVVIDTGNARAPGFNMTSNNYVGGPEFSFGNGGGQISEEAEGVAIGSGRIWIGDTGNHRVMATGDGDGEYKTRIGGYGSGDAEFESPRQVAIDADGVVYVADSENRRVVSISPGEIAPDHDHTPAVTIRSNSTNIGGGGATEAVEVSCNVDEICTGGGVDYISNANANLGESYPVSNGWRCQGRNNTGSSQAITCYAVCMTLPI